MQGHSIRSGAPERLQIESTAIPIGGCGRLCADRQGAQCRPPPGPEAEPGTRRPSGRFGATMSTGAGAPLDASGADLTDGLHAGVCMNYAFHSETRWGQLAGKFLTRFLTRGGQKTQEICGDLRKG